MFYSLTGTILEAKEEQIALQAGDVAFELSVPRGSDFLMGERRTVYCHEVFGESEHYLCGFATKAEKEAFLLLCSVKGIGPRTALGALRESTPDGLYRAIEAGNTAYLRKLPGIGPKAASQIILDLKGHLASEAGKKKAKNDPARFEEVREALRGLGFKARQVDEALAKIDAPNLPNEEILRLALRHLRKGTVQ